MAFLAEPFFNEQMNCNLRLSDKFNPVFILSMLAMLAGIGFISGIIPALVVNKSNPIEIVKGSFSRRNKNVYSKILISFQYVVAVVLLISSFGISRQSAFMQNYNVGFNKDNLFWMDNTINPNQKETFRDLLKSIPGVAGVTYSRGTPLDGGNNQSFDYEGNPISFQEFQVDSSFFNLMAIQLKKTGVAYTKTGVWVNKAAVKTMELGDNPQTIKFYDTDLPVLGIIEDFNFRSLHSKIGPLIVRQLDDKAWPWTITLKLTGTNLVETVKKIRKAQSSFTQGTPMESGFYDERISRWYDKEIKRSKLIGAFTLLSIIISSMGIFAMSLYYIQQKIKEIGIRKVNGAKVIEILTMLNYDFLVWVGVAFIIACPISLFIMQKWLQNFAYKTELSWWMFAFAGMVAFFIAILTVSWQSWRAARRNPVESLRYE
jgi:putative ABC transport system permease protein